MSLDLVLNDMTDLIITISEVNMRVLATDVLAQQTFTIPLTSREAEIVEWCLEPMEELRQELINDGEDPGPVPTVVNGVLNISEEWIEDLTYRLTDQLDDMIGDMHRQEISESNARADAATARRIVKKLEGIGG